MTIIDTLITKFEADTKGLNAALKNMSDKSGEFSKKLSQTKSIDKLSSQLKDVGLHMGKNGQIYKANTRGAIKEAEAIQMIIDAQKKAAFMASDRKALMKSPGGFEEIQAFSKMGTDLGRMKKQGFDVTNQIKEMNKRLAKSPEHLKAFRRGMNEGAKAFDMFNLSYMFSGMQMKMLGEDITKFMIPSMDKLNKLETEGAKQVGRLNAGFEFMKISMFEALSSTPLFKNLVEFLITASEKISEFVQEHPALTVMLGSIGALATLIGTAFVVAAGWNQFATVIYGLGSKIPDLLGSSGTGGTVGKALSGFKDFIGENWQVMLGLGASAAITGLSVAELVSSIKKKDWESAMGAGIAAALGIGAGAAFLMGFGPVGWILAISGAVVLTVSKLTVDDRTAIKAVNEFEGKNSGLFETMAGGVARALGMRGGFTGFVGKIPLSFDLPTEADEMGALTGYLDQYKNSYQSLINLQNAAGDETLSTEERINASKELNNTQQELIKLQSYIMSLDKEGGALSIQNLMTELEILEQSRVKKENDAAQVIAEAQAKADAESARSERLKEVTDADIINYSNVFAEQVKSKEETEKMMENIQLFGDKVNTVFGNEEDKTGVIGSFNMLSKNILDSETNLDNLRLAVQDWISEPTVKVITVRYEYENENGDTRGTFERVGAGIGAAADAVVGSVTGG